MRTHRNIGKPTRGPGKKTSPAEDRKIKLPPHVREFFVETGRRGGEIRAASQTPAQRRQLGRLGGLAKGKHAAERRGAQQAKPPQKRSRAA